jgi:hypothetical protein
MKKSLIVLLMLSVLMGFVGCGDGDDNGNGNGGNNNTVKEVAPEYLGTYHAPISGSGTYHKVVLYLDKYEYSRVDQGNISNEVSHTAWTVGDKLWIDYNGTDNEYGSFSGSDSTLTLTISGGSHRGTYTRQ